MGKRRKSSPEARKNWLKGVLEHYFQLRLAAGLTAVQAIEEVHEVLLDVLQEWTENHV